MATEDRLFRFICRFSLSLQLQEARAKMEKKWRPVGGKGGGRGNAARFQGRPGRAREGKTTDGAWSLCRTVVPSDLFRLDVREQGVMRW
jgi:hypothetical protein